MQGRVEILHLDQGQAWCWVWSRGLHESMLSDLGPLSCLSVDPTRTVVAVPAAAGESGHGASTLHTCLKVAQQGCEA
jgi:hypothetical protein